MSPTNTTIVPKRFRVAFSFAGEKRDFVARVAQILAVRFGEEKILYDKFHESDFARHDLGLRLPKLYSENSDLIVPVLCPAYNEKLWTGWEWIQIFGLLNAVDGGRVMPSRFQFASVEGLSPACGFIELDDKTPEEFAALILERLAINEGRSKDYYASTAATSLVDTPSATSNMGPVKGGARAFTPSDSLADIIQTPQKPLFCHASSAVWFSERFKLAFPGVRNEVKWITDSDDAVSRLQRLLQPPLEYKDYVPAWWFRGRGNNCIRGFSVIGKQTLLIDHQEFEIDQIAAIDCGQYWNHTVYVQVKAMQSSGADQAALESSEEMIAHRGYCDEEVCLFRGQYLKRSFYDDGAAEIDGKVVDLGNEAEVRIRYISPYNFLIAAHDSAINNSKFDIEQESLLRLALTDSSAVSILAQKISKLPKQVMYFR